MNKLPGEVGRVEWCLGFYALVVVEGVEMVIGHQPATDRPFRAIVPGYQCDGRDAVEAVVCGLAYAIRNDLGRPGWFAEYRSGQGAFHALADAIYG